MFEEYCNENTIQFVHGLPYNAKCQGLIESFNKTVKRRLFYIIRLGSKDLQTDLDLIVKTYNSVKHTTTRFVPKDLLFLENDEVLFGKVKSNTEKRMTRSVKRSKIQFQIGDCLLICNQFKKNNRSLQPLTSLFFRKKQRKLFIIPGKIIKLLGK